MQTSSHTHTHTHAIGQLASLGPGIKASAVCRFHLRFIWWWSSASIRLSGYGTRIQIIMINTETHRNAGYASPTPAHTAFVCVCLQVSNPRRVRQSTWYIINSAICMHVIMRIHVVWSFVYTSIRHLIDFNFLLFANLSLFALDIKLTITSAAANHHTMCAHYTHIHTLALQLLAGRRYFKRADERAARNASLSFAKVEIGIVDWFYFWMWKLCKQLDMSVVIVVVVVVGAAAIACSLLLLCARACVCIIISPFLNLSVLDRYIWCTNSA